MFACWTGLYILGYSLLRVSAYEWYQLPILFVLNLFFALGTIEIVGILMKYLKPKVLALATSAILTGLLLVVLARPTLEEVSAREGDIRGESYIGLSRWFRDNTKDSQSIAYIEIGYLGYFTDNRIIDLAGLTTPDIVAHVAEKDFTWGFWHYLPDYYVHLPDFDWALSGIRADARFTLRYKKVATLPGPGSASFIVYRLVND